MYGETLIKITSHFTLLIRNSADVTILNKILLKKLVYKEKEYQLHRKWKVVGGTAKVEEFFRKFMKCHASKQYYKHEYDEVKYRQLDMLAVRKVT